jgi:hypothetical protein
MRDGETVSQIVSPQALVAAEAGKFAGRVECRVQPRWRQSIAA